MKEQLKIAWRNVWRNKRRSIITISSIFFAVFFSVVMRSFQLGTYDHMIKNVIESFSGYIQIQHPYFKDDPVLDNAFVYSDEVFRSIKENENIKAAVPRIESFALASTGEKSKGAMVVGIDAELEKNFSKPQERIVKYVVSEESLETLQLDKQISDPLIAKLKNLVGKAYSSEGRLEVDLLLEDDELKMMPLVFKACIFRSGFLKAQDDGALVSYRLATYLNLSVGDTLILMGQGYHGSTAAGLFPVRGFVTLPSPDLDGRLIYIELKKAQEFFSMDKMITSLSINLYENDDDMIAEVQQDLESKFDTDELVVRNWKELNKSLVQQIEGDNVSGQFMLYFLYFIIFFGIYGTVIMLMHERKKEFGVLVSIGMQRRKLATLFSLEMLLVGFVGILLGIAASSPLIAYYHLNPVSLSGDMAKMMEDMGLEAVLPFAWFGSYIWVQAIIVVCMIVIASLSSVYKIFKLEEVAAMRG